MSGGLDIADKWSDSEDLQGDPSKWTYGPEHFDFLKDDMFEFDELDES